MSDLQRPKIKGVVDVVFLIDVTGSMGPCIDALKANIQSFVATMTGKDANNSSPVKDWRAKVVGFRDFEHDAVPIVDHPFVTTEHELRNQIASLEATGGVDEAESLLEALFHVADMREIGVGEAVQPDAWRRRNDAARVAVIFTDAPFKEPLAFPPGATYEDLYNLLISKRLLLSIFAPDFPCYVKLSEIDKAEWYVVSGGSTPQESLQKFTGDQKNFRKTLEMLAKTVSQMTAPVDLNASAS